MPSMPRGKITIQIESQWPLKNCSDIKRPPDFRSKTANSTVFGCPY